MSLPKVANYIRNVGKSVNYAAIDMVKEIAPATGDLIADNAELFKTIVYKTKNYKKTINEAKEKIQGSELYKDIELGFRNAKEDILSGNWYNKERVNKASEDFVKEGMDDDFGFGDSGGGDDEPEISSDSKAIIDMNKSSSSMIANSIVKSAELNLKSQKVSNSILYSQTEKMYSVLHKGLGTIDGGIKVMNEFNNTVIKTHAENSKVFYENATKLLQEQNAMLKELLEMNRNVYMNNAKNTEKEQKNKNNYNDIVDANGMPNLSGYLDLIKKNIGETVENSGLGMLIGDTGMGGSMLKQMAMNPLSFLGTFAIGTLLPNALKTAGRKFDATLSGVFGTAMSRILKMRDSDESNPLEKFIGSIFGVKNSVKSSINTANYNKGQMTWNGKAQKALVEVIPTYLSRIESVLSGKGERRFDYDKGAFFDMNTLKKEWINSIQASVNSATGDLRNEVLRLVGRDKEFRFSDRESQLELMNDIQRFFQQVYADKGFLDHNSIKNNQWTEKYDISELNGRIIKSALNTIASLNPEKLMQLSNNVLNARDARNRTVIDLEEKGSKFVHLFNNSGMERRRESTTDEILDRPGLQSDFTKIKDNLGHNLFYYLQDLTKNVRYIATADLFKNNRTVDYGLGGQPPQNTSGRRFNISRSGGTLRSNRLSSGFRNGLPVHAPTVNGAPVIEYNGVVYTRRDRTQDDFNIEDQHKLTPLELYNKNQAESDRKWQEQSKDMEEKGLIVLDRYGETKDIVSQISQEFQTYAINQQIKEAKSNKGGGYLYDKITNVKADLKQKMEDAELSIEKDGFINTLLKAGSLGEKYAVLRQGIANLAEQPTMYLTKIMAQADEKIYNFFFDDKDTVIDPTTGKPVKGFFGRMKMELVNVFKKANTFIDEKILIPLKEKLGVKRFRDLIGKGFKAVTSRDLKETMEGAKEKIKEVLSPFSEAVKKGFTDFFASGREELERMNEARKLAMAKLKGDDDEAERASNNIQRIDRRKEVRSKYEIDNIEILTKAINKNINDLEAKLVELEQEKNTIMMNTSYTISQLERKVRIVDIRIEQVKKKLDAAKEHKKQFIQACNKIGVLPNEIANLPEDEAFNTAREAIKKDITDLQELLKNENDQNKDQFIRVHERLDKRQKDLDELESNNTKYSKQKELEEATNTRDRIAMQYGGTIDKKENKVSFETTDTMIIENIQEELKKLNEAKEEVMDTNLLKEISDKIEELTKDLDVLQPKEEAPIDREANKIHSATKVLDSLSKRFKGMTGSELETELNINKIMGVRGQSSERTNKQYDRFMNASNIIVDDYISKAGLIEGLGIGNEDMKKLLRGIDHNKLKDLTLRKLMTMSKRSGYSDIYDKLREFSKSARSDDGRFYDNDDVVYNKRILDLGIGPISEADIIDVKSRQTGENFVQQLINDMQGNSSEAIQEHAKGAKYVKKTGLTAISEGEMIIPAEMNPFNPNRDKVDKKKEEKKEKDVKYNAIEKVLNDLSNIQMNKDGTKNVKIDNKDGDKGILAEGFGRLFGGISNFVSSIFGLDDKEKKDKDKSVVKFIEDKIPNATKGALGAGLGSLLLGMGNPLSMALLGAGAGILASSNNFKNFLFGEIIGEDENGNAIRSGGIISKEFSNSVKKYLPDLKTYGLAGAIGGIILPGFGPVTGLLLGSGVAFAKNNERIHKALFGDEDGLINKKTREKLEKAVPSLATGALVGALGTLVLPGGGFGLVGNALVGSALGLASTTNTFKDIMFGKEDSDGKRTGGIAGVIREEVINPLKGFAVDVKDKFVNFITEDIIAPLKKAMKPLAKDISLGTKYIGKQIVKGLDAIFSNTIGKPLSEAIRDYLISPIKTTFSKMFKWGGKLLGGIISSPFKLLGRFGDYRRAKHIQQGNADYMNANEREELIERYNLKRAGNRQERAAIKEQSTFNNLLINSNLQQTTEMRDKLGLLTNDKFMDEKLEEQRQTMFADINKGLGRENRGAFGTTRNKILKYINEGKLEKAQKMVYNIKNLTPEEKSKLNDLILKHGKAIMEINSKSERYKGLRDNTFEKLSKQFGVKIDKNNAHKYLAMLETEVRHKNKMNEEFGQAESQEVKDIVTNKNMDENTQKIVDVLEKILDEFRKNKSDISKNLNEDQQNFVDYNMNKATANGERLNDKATTTMMNRLHADGYTNSKEEAENGEYKLISNERAQGMYGTNLYKEHKKAKGNISNSKAFRKLPKEQRKKLVLIGRSGYRVHSLDYKLITKLSMKKVKAISKLISKGFKVESFKELAKLDIDTINALHDTIPLPFKQADKILLAKEKMGKIAQRKMNKKPTEVTSTGLTMVSKGEKIVPSDNKDHSKEEKKELKMAGEMGIPAVATNAFGGIFKKLTGGLFGGGEEKKESKNTPEPVKKDISEASKNRKKHKEKQKKTTTAADMNGQKIKTKTTTDGKTVADMSDSQTRAIVEAQKQRDETQNDIADGVAEMAEGFNEFSSTMKAVFCGKDKDGRSMMDYLKQMGLGILLWTVGFKHIPQVITAIKGGIDILSTGVTSILDIVSGHKTASEVIEDTNDPEIAKQRRNERLGHAGLALLSNGKRVSSYIPKFLANRVKPIGALKSGLTGMENAYLDSLSELRKLDRYIINNGDDAAKAMIKRKALKVIAKSATRKTYKKTMKSIKTAKKVANMGAKVGRGVGKVGKGIADIGIRAGVRNRGFMGKMTRKAIRTGRNISKASNVTKGFVKGAANAAGNKAKEFAMSKSSKLMEIGAKLTSIMKSTVEILIKKVFHGKVPEDILWKFFDWLKDAVLKKLSSPKAIAMATERLAELIPVVGQGLAAIDIGYCIYSGYNDAGTILKITREPTMSERMMCVAIKLINRRCTLGLIPERVLVDVFMKIIAKPLGLLQDLQKDRETAEAKLKEENEKRRAEGKEEITMTDYIKQNSKKTISQKVVGSIVSPIKHYWALTKLAFKGDLKGYATYGGKENMLVQAGLLPFKLSNFPLLIASAGVQGLIKGIPKIVKGAFNVVTNIPGLFKAAGDGFGALWSYGSKDKGFTGFIEQLGMFPIKFLFTPIGVTQSAVKHLGDYLGKMWTKAKSLFSKKNRKKMKEKFNEKKADFIDVLANVRDKIMNIFGVIPDFIKKIALWFKEKIDAIKKYLPFLNIGDEDKKDKDKKDKEKDTSSNKKEEKKGFWGTVADVGKAGWRWFTGKGKYGRSTLPIASITQDDKYKAGPTIDNKVTTTPSENTNRISKSDIHLSTAQKNTITLDAEARRQKEFANAIKEDSKKITGKTASERIAQQRQLAMERNRKYNITKQERMEIDKAKEWKKNGSKDFSDKQIDPKYNNISFNNRKDTVSQTINDSACGPFAASNIINTMNGDKVVDPVYASQYAAKNYKEKDGGTLPGFFSSIFNKFGLNSKKINPRKLRAYLESGHQVVMMGKDNKADGSTPYGPNPHYVVASGLDSNGNVIVKDSEDPKKCSKYNIDKVIKYSSMAISAIRKKAYSKYGSGKYGRAKEANAISAVKKKVWLYLTGVMKCTPKLAAAIMGNMQQESGFRPSAISGDGHGSVGLCQWTRERLTALKKCAAKLGKSHNDVDAQLVYFNQEINSGYKQLFKELMGMDNLIEMTRKFCKKFERPLDSAANYKARFNYATSILKEFAGKDIKLTPEEEESLKNLGGTSTGDGTSEEGSSGLFGIFDKVWGSTMGKIYDAIFGSSGSADGGDGSMGGDANPASGDTSQWMSTVKTVKAAVAAQNPTYSQSGTMKLDINGQKKTMRRDCSGFVGTCLKYFGVADDKENFTSRSFLNGGTPGAKKTGFTPLKWTGWNNLQPGDIISNNDHVEIFSNNEGNNHKVFSCGSDKSMRAPGTTNSGHKGYDAVWRLVNNKPKEEQKKQQAVDIRALKEGNINTKSKTTNTPNVNNIVKDSLNKTKNDMLNWNKTGKGKYGMGKIPLNKDGIARIKYEYEQAKKRNDKTKMSQISKYAISNGIKQEELEPTKIKQTAMNIVNKTIENKKPNVPSKDNPLTKQGLARLQSEYKKAALANNKAKMNEIVAYGTKYGAKNTDFLVDDTSKQQQAIQKPNTSGMNDSALLKTIIEILYTIAKNTDNLTTIVEILSKNNPQASSQLNTIVKDKKQSTIQKIKSVANTLQDNNLISNDTKVIFEAMTAIASGS